MPELPDVENYKRYLAATALHKCVAGVAVSNAKVLRAVSADRLEKALKGHALSSARRHGKHLLVRLDDDGWLTLHFGMTGRLQYFKNPDAEPEHERVRFDFTNGFHLAYVSQRMIGQVGLAEDAEAFLAGKGLGPDAMRVTEAAFRDLLAGRRGQIKPALMDQGLIAGLGNVYVDEILFQAGIHPKTPIDKLDDDRLAKLHRTMRRVLQTAIDRGAGAEDLVDRLPAGYLLPRREAGAPCPRCAGAVRKIKTAGRAGYYCPACQPAP